MPREDTKSQVFGLYVIPNVIPLLPARRVGTGPWSYTASPRPASVFKFIPNHQTRLLKRVLV